VAAPTTWTEVTGQGVLDWGEWLEVQVVSMFVVLDDTAPTAFTPGDPPRQVNHAGALGIGQIGDPLPDTTATTMGVSFWWWLTWEYTEIRFAPSEFQSFGASMWRLKPGVTLWYKINGV